MEVPEVLLTSSVANPSVYFIFRGNGEEVKIDLFLKTISHLPTFKEMNFIEEVLFIDITKFKVFKNNI